eukprot:TRINITY_DN1712_c0_g1_i3.p2 TRINITY_DN1712_c0_g1~~TRINITY_DN1712_c0_g1_i3.p2  ORF type:complete len:188 (+),score=42.64 TRINITY_DN1712_c0_g1_i3:796-1359(+)
MIKSGIFLLCLITLSLCAPPQPSYPYSTTMLRTHHFKTEPFLSIYEELSAYTDNGELWEAINIEIGWPFSIRDAKDTHVLGLRVVYRYDDIVSPTSFEQWYYMTDVDNVEHCVSHRTIPMNPAKVTYLGQEAIRNIDSIGYLSQDTVTGVNTTTWYTQDVDGSMYPFRIISENPDSPRYSEFHYLPD